MGFGMETWIVFEHENDEVLSHKRDDLEDKGIKLGLGGQFDFGQLFDQKSTLGQK